MIHKAFNITEDPWWRPEYCEHQGVDVVAKKIGHLQKIVRKEVSEDEFLQGYIDFHHQKYLLECISGESNIKMTFKDVERLLNVGFLQLYYRIFDKRRYCLVRKLHNLHKTTVTLFPNIFFSSTSLENLDVKFVKTIHYKVGKGIINNAGEFRKKYAKPAGEDFCYLDPHLIEGTLERVLEECRLVFSDPKLELLDAVKYGACFLTNFLYIHPFSNGNGRTARLLLSHLLTRFTIVPLSLYTSGEMREVYLQCLRESRYDFQVMNPASLSRFILEAIEKEYLCFCFAMNVDVK